MKAVGAKYYGQYYTKKAPRDNIYIRSIHHVRDGAKIRPKADGELGGAMNNNKCAFRGIPLFAQIVTVYLDAVLGEYMKIPA